MSINDKKKIMGLTPRLPSVKVVKRFNIPMQGLCIFWFSEAVLGSASKNYDFLPQLTH
jgi:hypothetical protein